MVSACTCIIFVVVDTIPYSSIFKTLVRKIYYIYFIPGCNKHFLSSSAFCNYSLTFGIQELFIDIQALALEKPLLFAKFNKVEAIIQLWTPYFALGKEL